MATDWNIVGIAAGTAFCGLLAVLFFGRPFLKAVSGIMSLPRTVQGVLAVFGLVATINARKLRSGTNAPRSGASGELRMENEKWKVKNGVVAAAGDTTILHSTLSTLHLFLLDSVVTNDSYSYAMPSDGSHYENWSLRGAYEDVFRLDLGEMRFPCGTNLCTSLWVYTWGKVRPQLKNVSNEIVATGVPMSAVPGLSWFWSAAEDDIIVTTTFTENAPDAEPVSSQSKLTSVKVELSSLNISLDDYPNRHIRGIGELVSCEWTPVVSGLSFQLLNGTACFASYSNRRDVTCPFQAVSRICIISADNAMYAPEIQVLEPTGIEARNPHRLSYSVPENSPGGAGFYMDLHIMPDTVSFQALAFWERPAYDSTIEGYFTNQAFQAVWYHDESMGAGDWSGIGDANFWFTDAAQMGDELITPVCPGRLVWHIPIDWRSRDNPSLIRQGFKSVDQTFEMSASGRLTVSKYQHWAAREMNGVTLKSEGMAE